MFQLSDNDQRLLLEIARAAVRSFLSREPLWIPEIQSGALHECHDVFVSIHKHGELRGCVGKLQPMDPLYGSAAECAISAAADDPRFMPLRLSELESVVFEISVLSPMEPIQNIADIEIGTHGLMVTKRSTRGLLLPQVAIACGWDRERFLEETFRKAGLHPDERKDGATIHRFRALVFAEKFRPQTAAP